MFFALVLFICILIYFLIEGRQHKKAVEKIPVRILVNGTRGKSTIVRLLVSALNECGIKTVGRSTGSEAQVILPNGSIEPIVRKRSARVYELIKFFKRAKEENAECVVVECMALQKENQMAIRDKLVRPTDVIICNTLVDHVPEMGTDVISTAKVLGCCIPKGANVYVTESYYDDKGKKVYHISLPEFGDDKSAVHPAAIAICKAFLESKDLSLEALDKAIERFVPDIGLKSETKVGDGSIFVPTFSVNDLTMMEQTILKYKAFYPEKKLFVIFNSRADREYRILLFKDILTRQKDALIKVYAIGDYKKKVRRVFSPLVDSEEVEIDELLALIKESKDSVFIGLGNIKGEGEKLLERVGL